MALPTIPVDCTDTLITITDSDLSEGLEATINRLLMTRKVPPRAGMIDIENPSNIPPTWEPLLQQAATLAPETAWGIYGGFDVNPHFIGPAEDEEWNRVDQFIKNGSLSASRVIYQPCYSGEDDDNWNLIRLPSIKKSIEKAKLFRKSKAIKICGLFWPFDVYTRKPLHPVKFASRVADLMGIVESRALWWEHEFLICQSCKPDCPTDVQLYLNENFPDLLWYYDIPQFRETCNRIVRTGGKLS